jgi:general secretion pathway protein C
MNFAASLQGLPDLATHAKVQRVMQWLPRIMTALITLVIAWQLAKLTWVLFPGQSNDGLILAAPYVPPPVTRVNVQKISDAHLFGMAVAPQESDDPLNVEISKAPLVLAGVMATPEPTKGFAFIGESAPMAKFRRVGDMLSGGVKLHSVYVDRVMLDRGGQLESLLLPRVSGAVALPPPVAARPQANQTRFAENLRRIAETNPSAFSEIVRPQPVFSGTTQTGYRVYPGRNRTQFAKLGLQPGDMITAVNGTPLTDQASSMQIFNTIGTSDRVSVTVTRNGQSQQITINTSQIDLPDAKSPLDPRATNPTTTDGTPVEGPNGTPAAALH